MEHLGDGVATRLDSPRYIVKFPYDNKGFQSFPGRAGWSIEEDGSWQVNEQFVGEYRIGNLGSFAAFLQAWLFFGLLAEVLGDDASLDMECFITQDDLHAPFVNTKKLPEYLEAWKLREVKRSPGWGQRMVRAQLALDRAHNLVSRYCSVNSASENPIWPVDKMLCLSFMVLGETLANAKIKILESAGSALKGWSGDANQGWGTSKAVLENMQSDGWCPHTVHMLQGLLKGQATGLLYALCTTRVMSGNRDVHASCTSQSCTAQIVDNSKYNLCHRCNDPTCCKLIGPKPADLVRIIREDKIPILKWESEEQMEVDVVEFKTHMKYAIVSHVWADGYGNPLQNKLPMCQLSFFRELFQDVEDSKQAYQPRIKKEKSKPPLFFWIDTLAIPVEERYLPERRMAIKVMHQTYLCAEYTIVLDKELMARDIGPTYAETAMRILVSGWMRRLWTLQEAYLSRKLYFNFSDALEDLDRLEEMFIEATDNLESALPVAGRSFFHNILGPERQSRIQNQQPANATRLLASVWKAAQWRTTSHLQHETLALATILHVDTDQLTIPGDIARDELMRIFLLALAESSPGAIPPGIIFLPGPRLSMTGYGWAPRTWLTAQQVDHPDPLSIPAISESVLRRRGLCVQHPGFLLNVLVEGVCIHQMDEFHFPSNSLLLDWYLVTRADRRGSIPTGYRLDGKAFAVILPRQQPGIIPEIALLVAVEEDLHGTFHVGILHRVWINRETRENEIKPLQHSFRNHLSGVVAYGEALEFNQKWCVDGLMDQQNSSTAITQKST